MTDETIGKLTEFGFDNAYGYMSKTNVEEHTGKYIVYTGCIGALILKNRSLVTKQI
jgi:hypothetical protein